METKVVVMIVMLALPSGESGVHVKPYSNEATCIEASTVQAADPFVRHVECSQLDEGLLTLKFERLDQTDQRVAGARRAG